MRPQGQTFIRLVAVLCGFALLASLAALPYIGGLAWAAGHESNKFLNTKCDVMPTPAPQRTTVYARDGKTVIATLGKGEFFGEMGVLEKAKRNATVVAKTQMTLLTLNAWDVKRLEKKSPEAMRQLEEVIEQRRQSS